MANAREEQLRNNRRLTRQVLGAVVLVLIVIGLFTVFGWCVGAISRALDDSDRKEAYADQLYGLVMFDTVAFEDASTVDPSIFRQAAIWGTVYQIQKRDGSLDAYERDSATGSIILPKLEVDTYLSNLLGPDYVISDGAFETPEFIYQYSDEKQGYLVPVTGSVGLYTPLVEKISTQSGKTYVTVGYVPTLNNSSGGELSLTAPTEPTKYMDYVFTRGNNRKWYLSGLQESETQPATTATPNPAQAADSTDPQTLVENNLDSTMTDAANSAASSEELAASSQGEEAQPAESGAEPTPDSEAVGTGGADGDDPNAASGDQQPAA